MSTIQPFIALRKSLNSYNLESFWCDLRAGAVVALIALPLGLALAVAIGVPPVHGLFTIVTAGAIVGLLGGSRHQVTGPTAAFVVVLLPIVQKLGLPGLLYAGFLAGLIMMVLSTLGVGRIIKMMPFPVVTGFTTGIAIVIFTLQLKDFLGLTIAAMPNEFILKIPTMIHAIPSFNFQEFLVGIFTITVIIGIQRVYKKTPGPIIGIVSASIAVFIIQKYLPSFNVSTIGTRYPGGIPSGFPKLFPFWSQFSGFTGFWSVTIDILPTAFTIAALGAIESLLSAVVADSMARTHHDPDTELFAQGVGNIVAPFFGGIAATGAIARTATNIRFGAISPISSFIHALAVLACLIFGSSLASYFPIAALAALLMVVAYNMADIKHVKTILKIGQREDRLVFIITLFATVVFDMTTGVASGLLLAMVLFVNRLINQSAGYWLPRSEVELEIKESIPKNIQLYILEGQLFFGAIQKAIASLLSISRDVNFVILDFSRVHDIDLTALTALYSAVLDIQFHKKNVCSQR